MQRLGVILFLTAVLAGGVVPPVAFSRGGGISFRLFETTLFSEGHDLCRSVINIGFFRFSQPPTSSLENIYPRLVGRPKSFGREACR